MKRARYSFAIGTAGSSTLVLQTVLPPLLTAAEPSVVRITGGTHNRASPPFDFLQRAFVPLIARMGARVELELRRYGFYPRGGGEIVATITPSALAELVLAERGGQVRAYAEAYVAALPIHIGQRELEISNAAVGEHLADQLLLPMALGQGGCFTTGVVSKHLRSNATIIETFTPRRVTIGESSGGFAVRVR